jgi:serine/threonine-protein kinase
MAEVWRARDVRLDREVAVKILSGPAAHDASMRRRIEREARALAAVSHRNIVSVYDYGEAGDGEVEPFIVMELVDGPDLHRFLETNGPLSVGDATEIMGAVLGAVQSAHEAGIVHGDLKPANVILSTDGPKVGDFGVARILAEETGTTTVAATPTFAAPEVLRGERPTNASDVYAAACLAFHMLVGRPPYEGRNGWEIAAKHQKDPVPLLSELRADVPPELEEAVRLGMSKDPGQRHASAADFATALAASPATVAVATPAVTAAPTDATEALPGRPDLGREALLGPFAGWAEGAGGRVREALRRRPMLGPLAAVVVLFALIAAALLARGGPELRKVPDVRGMTSGAAAGQLRTAGFATDVSYRPVTQGEPDIVIETIPAAGAEVEAASEIHIIASALARTPEPVAREEEPRGKAKGKHGKDEDD